MHSSATGALLRTGPGQSDPYFTVVPDAGGDARADFRPAVPGQGLALAVPG